MAGMLVNGIGLHFEEYGSGLPVSLLHGFAGTTRMWEPQIDALSASYRLIVHDMRGHGDSDAPPEPERYSLDLLLEDWHRLLTSLNATPAVVGGLSLGGYLALHFALQHPGLVRGLILADTGPGYRNSERSAEWNASRLDCARVLEEGGMDAFIRSPYSVDDYYTSPEIMRALDPVGLANVSKTVMIDMWGIDRLGEIRVPALILCGERDMPFLAASDYMERAIANARKVIIPNAGHGANVDNPDAFNDAVLKFLSEIDG
jgi:pimeloyl-ACP methyl ester carboxylesterase